MPRCVICRDKFEQKKFLQKTCSDKCEIEFRKNQKPVERKIVEYVPKKKTCKGVGITEGFGCGQLFLERKYGLGLKCCYNDWLHNSDEGKKKLDKMKILQKSDKRELGLKEVVKENKKKNIIEETRKIVHQYIRLRDEGKRCISCNKEWNATFQAGHFYKSELYSGLRFDERNIHSQCIECNCYKDGNFDNYKENLKLRISHEDFVNLQNESNFNRQYTWEKEELKELQIYFKSKIKQIKS